MDVNVLPTLAPSRLPPAHHCRGRHGGAVRRPAEAAAAYGTRSPMFRSEFLLPDPVRGFLPHMIASVRSRAPSRHARTSRKN